MCCCIDWQAACLYAVLDVPRAALGVPKQGSADIRRLPSSLGRASSPHLFGVDDSQRWKWLLVALQHRIVPRGLRLPLPRQPLFACQVRAWALTLHPTVCVCSSADERWCDGDGSLVLQAATQC
jgi:hypothetical protein